MSKLEPRLALRKAIRMAPRCVSRDDVILKVVVSDAGQAFSLQSFVDT